MNKGLINLFTLFYIFLLTLKGSNKGAGYTSRGEIYFKHIRKIFLYICKSSQTNVLLCCVWCKCLWWLKGTRSSTLESHCDFVSFMPAEDDFTKFFASNRFPLFLIYLDVFIHIVWVGDECAASDE